MYDYRNTHDKFDSRAPQNDDQSLIRVPESLLYDMPSRMEWIAHSHVMAGLFPCATLPPIGPFRDFSRAHDATIESLESECVVSTPYGFRSGSVCGRPLVTEAAVDSRSLSCLLFDP
jgi:hypothetical protein